MTAPRPTPRQRTKTDRSAGRRQGDEPRPAAVCRTLPDRSEPHEADESPPDRSGLTEADQDRERSQNTGMFGKAEKLRMRRPLRSFPPGRNTARPFSGPHATTDRTGRLPMREERHRNRRGGGRRRKGCVADGEALNRNRADAQGRDPYRTGDLSECSRHSRTFHTDGRRRRFRCAETSCSPSSWSGFCIREDRGTSHAVHSRPRLRHAVPERTGRRATSTPRAAGGRFARRTSDPDRKRISDCEPEIYAGADRLVCGTRNRTKRPIKKRDTATIRKTNNRHFGNTTIR